MQYQFVTSVYSKVCKRESINHVMKPMNGHDFSIYPGCTRRNTEGIAVDDTPAMVAGSAEHHRLEDEFLAKAETEYTFEEAVDESKQTPISSRELYVEDRALGIRGYIDELVLSPNGFTVIDDKPVGRTGKVYPSSKHQVYGYCIALKNMLGADEQRPITAAVRARGSDRIVWSEAFDTKAERKVQRLIKRVHGLLDGDIQFKSATQAYKCRPCRFFDVCDQRVETSSKK